MDSMRRWFQSQLLYLFLLWQSFLPKALLFLLWR